MRDGKPVVTGTDITVEAILRYADKRATMDQILRIFPRLSEDDVRAAINYSLPSPFRRFVRDQAFLAAAIVFAVVGMGIAAVGGFGLSMGLSRSGWPIVLALAPLFVPAAAAAIAAYVLVRRF